MDAASTRPRSSTRVGAAVSGRIVSAGWDGAYGQKIVVEHADGTQTWYCHLSAIAVHSAGSRPERSSAPSAAPATRPDRTCTSRCAAPRTPPSAAAVAAVPGREGLTPPAHTGRHTEPLPETRAPRPAQDGSRAWKLELLDRRVAQQQALHAMTAEVDRRL
ncbi:MAG: M23 family metallopeptidase [Actinomycetota bacterium]|nr:M23 family metallopeptidase [Actinomycetota bacterium]